MNAGVGGSTNVVMNKLSILGGAVTILLASTTSAMTPREIPSAFLVAKSSNRNQVHYAVRVDAACAPDGSTPVHPYWRMLEQSADATEPLTEREQRVLGIERQHVDGNAVHVAIRALPTRAITVRTWRAADGTCASSATITIAGVDARLQDVYVKQSLLGVDYVMLRGWSDAGKMIQERVTL